MYTVTGSNLFGQWFSDDPLFDKFRNISFKKSSECTCEINEAKLVYIGWSYNVFEIENSFYISGAWRGKENQFVKINLPEDISTIFKLRTNFILSGNDYNLVLVAIETYSLWVMSLEVEGNIKKINFNTEVPLILEENSRKKLKKEDQCSKVATTNHSCICLTSGGVVYIGMLPSQLNTSHCVGVVCDVECGYEHYILLTDAGRVYTWGNGRRLQLGHGDLNNLDSPTEVQALAGIRIVKTVAGGWHSLALSEYGDLYAWGWNDTGQLGIKEKPETMSVQGVLKKEGLKSYPLPTLVDIFDANGDEVDLNVKDIACGTRHSAILLEDNTIWTTGYNKYGQLGFSPDTYSSVDYFKKAFQCEDTPMLKCGPWTTVLIC